MKAKINKVTIEILIGKPISQQVEGLVNSTDTSLTLPEEIAHDGGPALEAECRLLGWCDVGSAVITQAGGLSFKHIIHVVGPRWGEGSERGKLINATWKMLELAEANQIKTLALPPISTGTHGYPIENCATVMISQLIDFTFEPLRHLRTILLCVETEQEFVIFVNEFRRQIQELRDTGEGKVRV